MIMASTKLEFLRTLTVEQFKAEMHADKLKVKRSKGSTKLYFTAGGVQGAVRKEGVPTKPMVSWVKGDITERTPDGKFWLLHQEGEGDAEIIAEL